MSEFGWPSIIVYLLSVPAIGLWAIASRGKMRASFETRRELFRKVALCVVMASAGFWFATVPYAGYFYDFSDNLDYPGNLESEADRTKYLHDHHQRIEVLERELKQQREESRLLREHYSTALNLGFYTVLMYGAITVFGRKDDGQPDEFVRSSLEKE